jgi:LysR family transcriptional regulator, transcriptional activator of nhaA
MEWLNYHHLRYFWAVAKAGSLRKAAEQLRVSEPSISAQIQALEESLGEELFRRSGRGLVLTETGRMVYGFAEEIFSLGQELLSSLKGMPASRELKLNVGLADSVPKLVAHEILKPVFHHPTRIHVVCREGKVDDLLAQLATLRLDIVLADEPAPTSLKVKTFNHLLGTCGVAFCALPALARKLRPGFPHSLHDAPALLPTQNTNLRRSLEQWFRTLEIRPRIVGEFEDAAMRTVVAAEGLGFMPISAAVSKDALTRYRLQVFGSTEQCTDQFYAITAERRLTHPAVLLITQNAQSRLFSKG